MVLRTLRTFKDVSYILTRVRGKFSSLTRVHACMRARTCVRAGKTSLNVLNVLRALMDSGFEDKDVGFDVLT